MTFVVSVSAASDSYPLPVERWVVGANSDPTWRRIASCGEDFAVKNPLLGVSDLGSQHFSPVSLTPPPPLTSIQVFFKADLFFSL